MVGGHDEGLAVTLFKKESLIDRARFDFCEVAQIARHRDPFPRWIVAGFFIFVPIARMDDDFGLSIIFKGDVRRLVETRRASGGLII